MLLAEKNAVVYGAGGTVGGAVARAFAAEGARVFLAGRTRASAEAVAREIEASGGTAEAAVLDALDEEAVERHLDAVWDRAGGVDVSFNAVGFPQRGVQGVPLTELSPAAFEAPIAAYARTNFLTARAAARRMAPAGRGAIVTLTATPARMAAPLVGGMGAAWAAVEALTRGLAAEAGPHGVRVLGVRSHALPETPLIGEVTALIADGAGAEPDDLLAGMAAGTLLGRMPALREAVGLVVFAASERAGGMTGTVMNVSAGALAD